MSPFLSSLKDSAIKCYKSRTQLTDIFVEILAVQSSESSFMHLSNLKKK